MAPKSGARSLSRSPSEITSSTAKPRRKRGFKFRYLAVAAVCGWAGYHYLTVQHAQLAMLQAKQQQLQAQLNSVKQTNSELQRQVVEFHNKDFIARYASQHFNLILPGQVAFDVKH